jgi:hypothetical protein
MKGFGYESLSEKLLGDNIHALDNVMTLSYDMKMMFNMLSVWFEAIVSDLTSLSDFMHYTKSLQDGQENTYAIKAKKAVLLNSCQANPITFTSQHPDLPLPNPTYLRIHAACCKVAHLSGAIEYIENILNDLEDIEVLSQSDSSAHVLMFALQPLGPI